MNIRELYSADIKEIKHHSYWKFTGDTVMVLFASNIIVPLTVGSFLLILQQENKNRTLLVKSNFPT